MLIIVIGLPGTGKTTFSKALAQHINAHHLNTDLIRDAVGMRGQYDENAKKRIYDLMLLQSIHLIRQRKTVIVDGTFYREKMRNPYRQLAFAARIPLKWIELKASEEVIEKRMAKSRPFSEADFTVYRKVRDLFEPFLDHCLTLSSDTVVQLDDMLTKSTAYIYSSSA